jgi:3-oxoacyl-[acyl-carrier protein] reductase
LVAEIAHLSNNSACIGIQADLRIPESASKIVKETVGAFGGRIDILINNAGAEVVKPAQDVTQQDFDYVYHLNVRAPMLLLPQVLPYLSASGRIINIGSVGARQGFKSLSLYCSSKAAIEGLTRCWAAELGERAITVNTVNPGPVQSDMLDNIPKAIIEMQKSLTPIENRVGTFDDISQIVAWLASEESRWVTGQSISASGGYDMY